MRRVYVTGPYRHPDPKNMDWRVQHLAQACAEIMLLDSNLLPYCLVVHFHPIVQAGNLSLDLPSWEQIMHRELNASNEMVVVTLPGWSESEGLRHEMDLAQTLGRVVRFYDPLTKQFVTERAEKRVEYIA